MRITRLGKLGLATLAGGMMLAVGATNCAQQGPNPVKAGSGSGGNGSGGDSGSGSGGNSNSSGSGGDNNGSGSGGNSSGSGGNNNGSGSGGNNNGSGSGGDNNGTGSGGAPSGSGGDSSGSGGTTGSGSGGATESGSGGRPDASCTFPSGNVTTCSPGLDPAQNDSGATSESLLSDFSPASWQNNAGKFGLCPPESHIGGAVQGFAGTMVGDAGVMTSLTAVVDTSAANMLISGTVVAGDYGGGIMAFAQCLNTGKYKGVKFTLGGTTGGCDLLLQIQTLSQQSDQYGGKCDHTANTCFAFPKKMLTFDTTGPMTIHFSDLEGTGMPSAAADFAKEIIGLQWQLQASSSGADCVDIKMTVDDVSLVTQ